MTLIKTFAITLLAASILASCRKDPNMNVTPASAAVLGETSSKMVISNDMDVSYNPAPAIRWTSAFVTIAEIKFEGERVTAEANDVELKEKVAYSSTRTVQIDLLSPDFAGTVGIPSGNYENVTVRMKVEAKAPSNFGIYMEGNYATGGRAVPIYVMAVIPMDINAVWPNRATIGELEDYMTHMNINVNKLLSGLDQSTLANLEQKDGTITISATSNTKIYNLILNNAKSMCYLSF